MIVGVLKTRAPGMTLARMPMFAWAMLVFAGMILIAFPAVILCTLLLELERALNWPFFDADARRRSAAVAAPVLVLRPPRGLHHLPARGRASSR
jgi:heme/copper-type cytochrome/quinol oxidase subunit 1